MRKFASSVFIKMMQLVVIVSLSGCGSVPMKTLMQDIDANSTTLPKCIPPTNGAAGGFAIQTAETQNHSDLIKAAIVRDVRLADLLKENWLSVEQINKNFDDIQNGLSDELKNDKVVNTLLTYMKSSAFQAQNNIIASAGLKGLASVQSIDQPSELTAGDFETFSKTVWKEVFEGPIGLGSKPFDLATQGKGTNNTNPPSAANPPSYKTAFIDYYLKYYKGNFIDRFGNSLPKPQISRTIGNDTISGMLTVFLELIADQVFHTPVWEDANHKYYPGGFDKKPTALETFMVKSIPLVTDGKYCGITGLKADAIQYLSHSASDKASAAGGLIVGSVGGWELGLGFLGKFSIGDSQTLNVLVKTALAEASLRSAMEASSRVLFWVPYDNNAVVADLVQQYLTTKNTKAK